MALLVIQDDQGKSHLVHSSMFGATPARPARAIGEWSRAWERFDEVTNEVTQVTHAPQVVVEGSRDDLKQPSQDDQ